MTTRAETEATVISRAAAVIATILVLVSGVFAAFDLFQASGLGLLAALVTSIASVTGRPGRRLSWIGPAVIGAALISVIVAGFLTR